MSKNKMRWWGGYTFGWKNAIEDLEDYCWGCVISPKWWENAYKEDIELPLILDNGAYPAWRDNIDLDYEIQKDHLKEMYHTFSHKETHIVLPDVVGDCDETIHRINKFLEEEKFVCERSYTMCPIQEGMIGRLSEVERDFDSYFVGGETIEFKVDSIESLQNRGKRVHVARVGRESHMRMAANTGADSFDTTTFLRNNDYEYRDRVEKWCERRY